MSLNVRSTVSNAFLFAIGASSPTMDDAHSIEVDNSDCLLNLHIDKGSNLIGTFNLECAVLPPGSRFAAIPDIAVANIISTSFQNVASKDLYKNVLPIPPGTSTKKLYSVLVLSLD
ncbi:UNVERIFIED_CONTAM: hypothetical protein Sangu_0675000 [Sesamum angustifolium]|uniref:Uncharacterized protein n=1 Tax=Sesamum angustifolium TaxID=2727405 RepID=A0AAW2PU59_9LAMI